MQILQIISPIFLLILAGLIFQRRGVVNSDWVHVLNKFVYYVSLPSLITVSFWQIDWLDGDMLRLVGINAAALLAFAALLLVGMSFFRISAKLQAAFFLVCMVGNTVYMGFPVAGAAFGPDKFSLVISSATAHLVLGLVFSILAIEYLVVKSKKIGAYAGDFIKNPLMVSVMAGILLSLAGAGGGASDVVKKSLLLLGGTASPVALFALGGFLHGNFYRAHFNLAMLASAVKLLLLPLFVMALAGWMGAGEYGLKVSALVASMPVAVTAFVVAEKYKLDAKFVANAVLVSTAASAATIAALLLGLMP